MILTLLTRIGENSKLVLIGDTKQVDKVYKNQTINGLTDASQRLQGLHQVGIVNFLPSDCVRHPIIPEILERYED
jgi:phosphate starvation-inducible protein PhoH